MKRRIFILAACAVLVVIACATNPYTGKSTLALVDNDTLLASSFSQYQSFLDESDLITGTPEAALVERVGNRIRLAAEKWAAAEGQSAYLEQYRWEYRLVESDEVNAWCMPGGKIVVYTGILPVTEDEDGLAVVLGHEVAHALLNHGQQRSSAGMLQQIGAAGIDIFASEKSRETQDLAMTVYGAGSNLFGILPFSRSHENEADHIGLILMAIAGYNPEISVPFWQRMSALGGGGTPEFLSTHPSGETRTANLAKWIPEAKEKAALLGTGG
ncbi:MAG: M48 family metallopeptidase [Treponema sp.]|jgi:predicted Zn-dependent protease|nr:M48 family metallopeptidase [Treponema sp.]